MSWVFTFKLSSGLCQTCLPVRYMTLIYYTIRTAGPPLSKGKYFRIYTALQCRVNDAVPHRQRLRLAYAVSKARKHGLCPAAIKPCVYRSLPFCGLHPHPRNPCKYTVYCSFTDPVVEGWVGFVSWPIADMQFTAKWSLDKNRLDVVIIWITSHLPTPEGWKAKLTL